MLAPLMMTALMAAAGTNAVVVRPVANMYSQANADADVVSQAIYASNIAIIERQGDWAKVRTADDYIGWMTADSLRSSDRAYASTGRVARVESLFANIYREPDVTKHQPLITIPFDAKLEVIAEQDAAGRWLQVRLPDDRPGWLQSGDVTFKERRFTIPETIALSQRFVGLPYFWGGVSTFGFDCSGFTQMLCRRRGIAIPRDSGPQARWAGGVSVERAHLEPGDLVFFGQSKITHTGMYVGNGKFISATTHERPMIQLSELDDPYWKKLFITARRVK
jgi:cell wall-associated NlpC family hydrolase